MVRISVAVALALPFLVSATLPPCGDIDRPCSCPSGSTFHRINTYATIGATAKNVGAVMNDFFNTSYFDLTLLSTTGTDDVVGATRTFSITADNSITLTEELIQYQVNADGSFIQRYKQDTTPILLKAPSGNAYFDGYWETIAVQQTSISDESTIQYNAYRCDIGSPFDTAGFHETSINDTIAVLKKEGKNTGKNLYPYSITLSV